MSVIWPVGHRVDAVFFKYLKVSTLQRKFGIGGIIRLKLPWIPADNEAVDKTRVMPFNVLS